MNIRLEEDVIAVRVGVIRSEIANIYAGRKERRGPSVRRSINEFFAKWEIPETLLMAALALIYVGLNFVDEETIRFLTPQVIESVIYAITAIFIVEFSIRIYAAESRWKYLRHHLFDLLAVLPSLQFLRLLGLARLAVLLRLLRLVRVGVIAHGLIGVNTGLGRWKRLSQKNGLTTLFALSFGFVWIGADLAYQFEHGVNPQFGSFADSIWWAFSTMATLGYGTGPVTLFGRLVAAVLMILGIACFGLVTATATTFFVQRTEKVREYSSADIMHAIKGIDSRLSSLERELASRSG